MTKVQPYAEYKDSGVEWLGLVPSSWTVIKTGHVTHLTTGWTPPTSDSDAYIGNNLWANISDLGPKILGDTAKRISDGAIAAARSSRSRKGSLLFSFKLSVGQVSFAGTDMYTNEAIATFEDTARLSTRFAYYALPIYLLQNANENIYGAKLLNQDLMNSARLCLPDKSTQNRIADYLDRETAQIDDLIGKQERLIELLAEKRQAVITQVVTKGLDPNAPTKPSGIAWLGDMPVDWALTSAKRVSSLFVPQRDKPELNKVNGYPWITSANLGQPNLVNVDTFVTEEAANRSQSRLLRAGSVLATCVGRFGVTSICQEDVVINQQIHGLIATNEIRPHFLRHAIAVATPYFESIATSTTIPYVNGSGFENMPVALPPLAIQDLVLHEIDSRVSRIDRVLENSRQVVALLYERRSALISAAVTGKIDVREGVA